MTSVAHGNAFGFAGIDIKSYFMGFSYEKALVLTQQEPERQFLQEGFGS
jgi:hypothetical protein